MTVRVFIAMGALVAAGALSSCSSTSSESAPKIPRTSLSASTETQVDGGAISPLSRVEVQRSGGGACVPNLPDGDVISVAGPGFKVVSGPVTVTGLSTRSPFLGLKRSAAVRWQPDEVASLGFVVGGADLAGTVPTGKPYVRGSRTALEGTTFTAPPLGVVPIVSYEVDWPESDVPVHQSTEVGAIGLRYTDASGELHEVDLPVDLRITNWKGGCKDRS